jgi:hypothetical protein
MCIAGCGAGTACVARPVVGKLATPSALLLPVQLDKVPCYSVVSFDYRHCAWRDFFLQKNKSTYFLFSFTLDRASV